MADLVIGAMSKVFGETGREMDMGLEIESGIEQFGAPVIQSGLKIVSPLSL